MRITGYPASRAQTTASSTDESNPIEPGITGTPAARIAASSRASIAAWNRARTAAIAEVAGSTTGTVGVGVGAWAQPTRSASGAAHHHVAEIMRGV